MCHPGRPGPQGLSQLGSPALAPFQSAKSAAPRFRASTPTRSPARLSSCGDAGAIAHHGLGGESKMEKKGRRSHHRQGADLVCYRCYRCAALALCLTLERGPCTAPLGEYAAELQLCGRSGHRAQAS
eukprot:358308-Chlamydomonas_euryale.AAC.10